MKISILIPVRQDNEYLRECIEKCLQLDYPHFEIIVLPDTSIELSYGDTLRVIPTGAVGPAQKRDMAIQHLRGDIVAFLDDDTFPASDWLSKARDNFTADEEVAAVCGPAVTPETDTVWQKASGLIYSSLLVSGAHRRRYISATRCEVDDYPSCNFLVRTDVFKKIGGFDTRYWPGEDTVLCLKIIKDLKKKIVYDPQVIVYHHRRPLFLPHLKQIKSYALHRGYFVKRFPDTSLRIEYFIPTMFVSGIVAGGMAAIFVPLLKVPYAVVTGFYALLVLFSALRHKGLKLRYLAFLGILLTHMTYGIFFVKGLFINRLAEE